MMSGPQSSSAKNFSPEPEPDTFLAALTERDFRTTNYTLFGRRLIHGIPVPHVRPNVSMSVAERKIYRRAQGQLLQRLLGMKILDAYPGRGVFRYFDVTTPALKYDHARDELHIKQPFRKRFLKNDDDIALLNACQLSGRQSHSFLYPAVGPLPEIAAATKNPRCVELLRRTADRRELTNKETEDARLQRRRQKEATAIANFGDRGTTMRVMPDVPLKVGGGLIQGDGHATDMMDDLVRSFTEDRSADPTAARVELVEAEFVERALRKLLSEKKDSPSANASNVSSGNNSANNVSYNASGNTSASSSTTSRRVFRLADEFFSGVFPHNRQLKPDETVLLRLRPTDLVVDTSPKRDCSSALIERAVKEAVRTTRDVLLDLTQLATMSERLEGLPNASSLQEQLFNRRGSARDHADALNVLREHKIDPAMLAPLQRAHEIFSNLKDPAVLHKPSWGYAKVLKEYRKQSIKQEPWIKTIKSVAGKGDFPAAVDLVRLMSEYFFRNTHTLGTSPVMGYAGSSGVGGTGGDDHGGRGPVVHPDAVWADVDFLENPSPVP